MQKYLATVLLGLTFALPALAQEPAERWSLPLDAREWNRVPPVLEAPPGERIYVRPGESAYFWTERITSGHRTLGPGSGPDDYINGFLEDLAGNCRPLKVSPVDEQPTSVIFQWEGECRIVGAQFEFRRVAVDKDGLHYLAYAAKPNRLTPQKKEAWLAILRGAALR